MPSQNLTVRSGGIVRLDDDNSRTRTHTSQELFESSSAVRCDRDKNPGNNPQLQRMSPMKSITILAIAALACVPVIAAAQSAAQKEQAQFEKQRQQQSQQRTTQNNNQVNRTIQQQRYESTRPSAPSSSSSSNKRR